MSLPEAFTLSSFDLLIHFGYRAVSSVHRNPLIMAHATRVGHRWRWRVGDLEAIHQAMRRAEAER